MFIPPASGISMSLSTHSLSKHSICAHWFVGPMVIKTDGKNPDLIYPYLSLYKRSTFSMTGENVQILTKGHLNEYSILLGITLLSAPKQNILQHYFQATVCGIGNVQRQEQTGWIPKRKDMHRPHFHSHKQHRAVHRMTKRNM